LLDVPILQEGHIDIDAITKLDLCVKTSWPLVIYIKLNFVQSSTNDETLGYCYFVTRN